MDVQMPEMGGLEATTAIREKERGAAAQGRAAHVPIVALTARAMTGDREQCFAAGMDAYVSKPVRAEELFAAIDAVMAPASQTNPKMTTETVATESAAVSIDRSALLANFAGRADLVRDVIDVFLVDAPLMLTRLENAARSGNAPEIAATAHAIKGSAGLFSQGDAYAAARALELRAREGDVADSRRSADEVASAVSHLMNELRDLRAKL